MTQRFKLGYKLLPFYAIPVLLSGISAIAVYTTVGYITKLSENTQSAQELSQNMDEMVYGLSRMTRNVRGQALFPHDPSYFASYNEGQFVFQARAKVLMNTVQEPQQRQHLLNIIKQGEYHNQVAQRIFQLIQQQRIEEAITQVPLIRMEQVDSNYKDFDAIQKNILVDHTQSLGRSLFSLNMLVITSTLLGLVVGGVGYLFSKRLEQTQQIERESQILSQKNQQLEQTQAQLIQSFKELEQAQSQLVQAEKMSSLGQLVAGVAHEINNPINFIHGNLTHIQEYFHNLIRLVQGYQTCHPQPLPEIQKIVEESELEFLQEDLPRIFSSMKMGTDRIRHIVSSLRNFSRLDEAEFKTVDLHEGLDSTLLILQHRLKAKPGFAGIEVRREYGQLPLVECYAGQLNQVFMNILANAIDALEDLMETRTKQDNPSQITIRTAMLDSEQVQIAIADNGLGIPPEIQHRIFDPFFTTKPVGKGTGIGMSISYQIITNKHNGKIECISRQGQGAEFLIQIPILQKASATA